MFVIDAPVEEIRKLDNNIFLQKLYCPKIANNIKPGEFLNIKVTETSYPLLRRPFSVCDVDGDYFYLMYNVYGEGTRIMSRKHKGETINILGPLGNGFNFKGDFDTAIIVAGGLGAAPFPFVTRKLKELGRVIYSFVGGRTEHDIISYGMEKVSVATDDGSRGFKGNVVELLKNKLDNFRNSKIKIFACGPNVMLKALKDLAIENNINCEASTECAMACGFGICQGCPIESAEHPEKYFLVCKDGPVFNVKDVVI